MDKLFEVIIEKFGDDYKYANKTEIRYNCPFCIKRRGKSDNDRKLYVNIDSGKFHCFKCNAKGLLSYKKNSLSTYGVYDKIDKLFNGEEELTNEENDDILFYMPSTAISKKSLAYEYCLNRGITEDLIDYYNIRLGVEEFWGRIIIPNEIYSEDSLWTDMFSARTYTNQIPKYKNPENCKKTNAVFNLHNIKEHCDTVIVVEGVITAICAGKDAVAIYGCHPSDRQISLILDKKPKSIICSLDNDKAGKLPNGQMAETFSKISKGISVFTVYLPEGLDASDMGEKSYLEYVNDNKILYNSSVYDKIYSLFK